ncbi:MAG: glutathione peroxidase [Phycisphaerales bacterium]
MKCFCSCRGSKSGAAMIPILAASGVIFMSAGSRADKDDPAAQAPAASTAADYAPLKHTLKRIDGSEQNLAEYRGKVVMIVNTASKCGLTPQYEALEALYRKHKDEGFVILAFPANNFMDQEPGSDAQIDSFCKETYDVTFPMFSKISVKGGDMHPLYKQLTSLPDPLGGEIRWNFDKFLIDRHGNVVERFHPKTKPDEPQVVELLGKLLVQPVPKGA